MTEIPSTTAASAAANPAPRPGVPVWRVGKPDAFLAADVDTARAAVATIASDSAIGKHVGARSEGVRCVTHLFESKLPGYAGWVWFASLSRVSRGKESTVNEVGMLPTEDSVLAPAWVPWAERVRPEDQEAEQAAIAAQEAQAAATAEDHGSEDDSDPDPEEASADDDAAAKADTETNEAASQPVFSAEDEATD